MMEREQYEAWQSASWAVQQLSRLTARRNSAKRSELLLYRNVRRCRDKVTRAARFCIGAMADYIVSTCLRKRLGAAASRRRSKHAESRANAITVKLNKQNRNAFEVFLSWLKGEAEKNARSDSRDATIYDGLGVRAARRSQSRTARLPNRKVEGEAASAYADGCADAGLIDTHTHYDAQITWIRSQPRLPRSASPGGHGHCGFTIAPCRPPIGTHDAQPHPTREGCRWRHCGAASTGFESFPEYVGMLEKKARTQRRLLRSHSGVPLSSCVVCGSDRDATKSHGWPVVTRNGGGACGFSTTARTSTREAASRCLAFATNRKCSRCPARCAKAEKAC